MYVGGESSLVYEKAAPACLRASKPFLVSVVRKGGGAFSGELNLGAHNQILI